MLAVEGNSFTHTSNSQEGTLVVSRLKLTTLAALVCAVCGCNDELAPEIPESVPHAESEPQRAELFAAPPTISENPNEAVPLAAIVEVHAEQPVVAALEIDDGDRQWTWRPRMQPDRRQKVVLFGLRPGRKHQVVVRLEDSANRTYDLSEPLVFETPPLPEDFPNLQATVSRPDLMEPGVTLFPTNVWHFDRPLMDYGYLVALDAAGEVVWYMKTGHRTASVEILENGHLLYNHAGYRRVFEINLLGDVIREWHAANIVPALSDESIPVECDTFHHEVLPLDDDRFLALTTTLRLVAVYQHDHVHFPLLASSHVVGDEIIEFRGDGEVLRRLNLFDYLDIDRLCYGAFGNFWNNKYIQQGILDTEDWTHANAILTTDEPDWIIVSLRHQDCLIKMNFDTGEIRWILGDPTGWKSPWREKLLRKQGDWTWNYHQHGPEVTSRGTLLMYDNGNYRAIPPNEATVARDNFSRVLELKVDEEAMTVSKVWEYRGEGHEPFYCPFYCEADQLPETGNILVTDGGHIEYLGGVPADKVPSDEQWARIFEITYDTPAELVWEVRLESERDLQIGWSVYRSERIASLLPFAEKLQVELTE